MGEPELQRAVAAGSFREDLYYRLAVLPVQVPPLRERPEDLRALVHHFLERHARGGARFEVCEEAFSLLLAHRWSGNVRELENETQHALALAEPPG